MLSRTSGEKSFINLLPGNFKSTISVVSSLLKPCVRISNIYFPKLVASNFSIFSTISSFCANFIIRLLSSALIALLSICGIILLSTVNICSNQIFLVSLDKFKSKSSCNRNNKIERFNSKLLYLAAN